MTETAGHPLHALEKMVIRFAGDSGDGMQLTGARFSVSSAMSGDDLSTVPDYPAEIYPNWASWWTSRGRPASFRAVDRPDYGSLVNRQVVAAGERLGPGDLGDLLSSGTTWQT